jgi:hypothetical protein
MTPSSLTRPLPLFSGRGVNAKNASSIDLHPAGAGNSERSFARSQRRFRHHYEVKAPALRLRFHAEDFREPVRSGAPSLDSVSNRTGRIRHPGPVVRANLRRCCDASRLHSPSGLSTFRIKAFDRPHHNKLASPDATVVYCSPLRSLSISPRIVAQNPFSANTGSMLPDASQPILLLGTGCS